MSLFNALATRTPRPCIARERLRVVSLDDEVEVVAEHGELDQPQPEPAQRRLEARSDRAEAAAAPQIPDVPVDAHGDEDRSRFVESRSRPMGHQRTRAFGFAACSATPPAMGRQTQRELSGWLHDWGQIARGV